MPAPKNIVYPNRQSLLNEAVNLCERWQAEPTRQAVHRLLEDIYAERYEQGLAKGGTFLTEALQRILDWDNEYSSKFDRFVQDVLRAYKKIGQLYYLRTKKYANYTANLLYPKRVDLLKAAVNHALVEGATTVDEINDVLHRKWADAYRRGVAKGGTDLSRALDDYVGWSIDDDHRWDRFLADVAKEVRSRSGLRKVAYSFNVGDVITYGKYKNKKGKVIAFGSDPKGNPTVTIEPLPKGRKQNKTMGLFKIWKLPEETAKQVTARYLGR